VATGLGDWEEIAMRDTERAGVPPVLGKVFWEVASGAKTDRGQLRRLLDSFALGGDGDPARPAGATARPTRDLVNTLAAIS
jgi:hypothetical protein